MNVTKIRKENKHQHRLLQKLLEYTGIHLEWYDSQGKTLSPLTHCFKICSVCEGCDIVTHVCSSFTMIGTCINSSSNINSDNEQKSSFIWYKPAYNILFQSKQNLCANVSLVQQSDKELDLADSPYISTDAVRHKINSSNVVYHKSHVYFSLTKQHGKS